MVAAVVTAAMVAATNAIVTATAAQGYSALI